MTSRWTEAGQISPFSFVRYDRSRPSGPGQPGTFAVVQATEGDEPCGVASQFGVRPDGNRRGPTTLECGAVDEVVPIRISPTAERRIIPGTYLRPAADGFAIEAVFGQHHIGAVAHGAAEPGERVEARIVFHKPAS